MASGSRLITSTEKILETLRSLGKENSEDLATIMWQKEKLSAAKEKNLNKRRQKSIILTCLDLESEDRGLKKCNRVLQPLLPKASQLQWRRRKERCKVRV